MEDEMDLLPTLGKCDVCDDEPAIGVCCVPGVPVSMAYGRKCIDANAHPWGVLTAQTAMLGGLENAAPWWREMVDATCKHLGKTIEQFNEDVAESEKKLEQIALDDMRRNER